jgi:Domain of unknown function (DUF4124)
MPQRETGQWSEMPHAGRSVGAAGRAHARAAIPVAAWFAALVFVALMLSAPAVRATTYKWVDDQGVVHYSDKLPPEAVNKGNVELSKQGIPLKKTDPALTPDQLRAREAEDERVRQATRVREEIQRKDRALLQTYTMESEIDLARSRALSTIDAQIQSAQAYTNTLTKRKQDISARLAAFGDKTKPIALERELVSVNEELDKQAELIATKKKEATVVSARYDADKQRWHELRTVAESEAAAANTPPPTVPKK